MLRYYQKQKFVRLTKNIFVFPEGGVMGLINLVSVYNMSVADIADGKLIFGDKTISTNLTLSPTDVYSVGGTNITFKFQFHFLLLPQRTRYLLVFMTLVFFGCSRQRWGWKILNWTIGVRWSFIVITKIQVFFHNSMFKFLICSVVPRGQESTEESNRRTWWHNLQWASYWIN